MSAARSRSYRPARDRREVMVAVLSSLAVLVVTGVLLWVLAPNDDSDGVPIEDLNSVTNPTPPIVTTTSTAVPGG